MPNAIMEARALISNIQEARMEPLEKKRLLYVNSLEHKKIQDRKQVWLYREPDYGLSPLVSEMQASPVMPQGTYRQFEAGPICTRHIKRFSSEELQNLVSPDARYRLNTKEHIAAEMIDSERRIWDTMELVACEALVLGSVKYVLNDAIGRLSVDIAFPVPSATVSASWHTTSTDIPADMNTYIKLYRNRFGRKPAKMRMTSKVWDSIKINTKVIAAFSSYIRVIGLKASDVPTGMITPEFVVKALDWPTIELYDERTAIKFHCVNSESEGSQTIELKEGTWGVKIGDTLLCKYVTSSGYESWDFECDVTAVTDGVSVTATIPTGKTLSANDTIVVRPTFFPQDRVQFCAESEFSDNKFILPPFGLDYTGSSISAANWYGPKMDVFQLGTEPGLMAARRIWHEFGVLLGNPNSMFTLKIVP